MCRNLPRAASDGHFGHEEEVEFETEGQELNTPSSKKLIPSVVAVPNPHAASAHNVETAGEIFPNATIDLVADPSDSYALNLLLWDGSSATVAPRIEYGRSTYEPIVLEQSLVHAVQWPKCPIQYGSTRNLFDRVFSLITQHVEIQNTYARLLTYFVFSTWFPDRLSLSPGFAILGALATELPRYRQRR